MCILTKPILLDDEVLVEVLVEVEVDDGENENDGRLALEGMFSGTADTISGNGFTTYKNEKRKIAMIQ